MLATLKAKRAGDPSASSALPSLNFRSSVDSSPETSSVLVPSSSPAKSLIPPVTSKFFSGNMSAPLASTSNGSSARPACLPSSNLSRRDAPAPNGNGSGASGGVSGGPFNTGSPAGIMSALHNRHNQDNKRASTGGGVSYEVTPSSSTTAPLSPDSPQPLSRLKSKYTSDIPTRPLPSFSSPVSSVGTLKRTPSLIAAAKQQVSTGREAKARRFAAQFPRVSMERILEIIKMCGEGEEGKLHGLLKLEDNKLKTISSEVMYPTTISTLR